MAKIEIAFYFLAQIFIFLPNMCKSVLNPLIQSLQPLRGLVVFTVAVSMQPLAVVVYKYIVNRCLVLFRLRFRL